MPAGTGKRGSERDLEEVVGVRGCQRHKAEVMAAGALCRRERRIDAAAGVGSRSSERAGESSRLGLPEAEAVGEEHPAAAVFEFERSRDFFLRAPSLLIIQAQGPW